MADQSNGPDRPHTADDWRAWHARRAQATANAAHLICAWCGTVLTAARLDAPVNHGLCPDCAIRLLEEDRSPT